MEIDNGKGTFLARLFLINLPVISLLGTGILAIFLIIHTWLPVIISGAWVIAGWLVSVAFRLTFVKLIINNEKVKVLYYPVRILRGNYKRIEIRKDLFDGAEMVARPAGWIRNLVLFEKTSQGKAAYPPVNLSLFTRKQLNEINKTFNIGKPASAGKILLLALLLIIPAMESNAQNRRLSVSSLEETLHNGKVIKSSSDLYYDLSTGKIVAVNRIPEEFIYISDPEGKAQIYYPAKNQVLNSQNLLFSSRNNNLWFFLNDQGFDLGLQGMGFKVVQVRQEDSFTVTTWQAPLRYLKDVDKVDLVHENHLPVYLEYRNTKGTISQKIYYSDFVRAGEASIPTRVTEILFKNPQDSTIRRSTYTNIQWGDKADKRGFDYRIPPDATPLK
jgi:hypothetical protein